MLSPYCQYIIPMQAGGLIVCIWAIEDNTEIQAVKDLFAKIIKRTSKGYL